jgi:hypothetical protein
MKRNTIKLLLIIIGIVLLVVPFFFMRYHHRTAADYKKVMKVVDVQLPEIIEVQSWDNYDRGASRWDCLEHYLRFERSLPENTIQELERRCEKDSHWTKDETGKRIFYEYSSEPEWTSDLYFLSCRIYEDSARIEYYIDEDEGIFCFLIPIAVIFIAFVSLLVWLIIKVTINFFRRKR